MLESLIISEFQEKDYIIFEQQILGVSQSPTEFKQSLDRILESKSQSLKDKVALLLREEKEALLETAFKRALKRHKRNIALRFMLSETREMGE
jgi:hypothetical protein